MAIPRSRGTARAKKKDCDRAIKDYNEAIRLNPGSALVFANRGMAWHQKKAYEQEINDYEEALRLDSTNVSFHNRLAWVLATCPNDGLRDGKQAIDHTTEACERSSWKDPNYLDTLAAAYVESGDCNEAVRWQAKAIELGLSDPDAEAEAKAHLHLYE
ncbi:MAG TPA: hypothetical protein VKU02_15980 [Gemmataceae bacterium]|nr:hypothetical protein [Gemmataceae bacterium]